MATVPGRFEAECGGVNMTLREILVDWLKSHGYDGLCNSDNDNCGCSLDDFMPCGDIV